MKLLLTPLLICAVLPVFGQMWNGTDTLYGNEWIRFDQSYFKISVPEDGVYRIPFETLAAAGIPAGSIPPADFRIFHNGREIPLQVSAAGALTAGDFIEFAGLKNRDELDRYLFEDPDNELLNPEYSMFTDTAAYFLTWSPQPGSQRYQTVANNLNNLPPKEEWFWFDLKRIYSNGFIQKTNGDGVSESSFEAGEGFSAGFTSNLSISLKPDFLYPAAENAAFRTRFVASHGFTHQLSVSVDNTVIEQQNFSGVRLLDLSYQKPATQLAATETIKVTGAAPNNDRYAVAFGSLRYPRAFNFGNQSAFFFEIAAGTADKYLEIEKFDVSGGQVVLYDLTNQQRIAAAVQDGKVLVRVGPSGSARQLVLVNLSKGLKTVTGLQPVQFTDFSGLNADYLIISHAALFDDGQGRNWVQAYADYRAGPAGGGFHPAVADIRELYDQFGYGINRHPAAVRNFVHFVHKQWDKIRYVLLIGKGREYGNVRRADQLADPVNRTFYVPTFGQPGSDALLIAPPGRQTPLAPIGRIPAAAPRDIEWYLEKVKEYEDIPSEEEGRGWRKEVIHLGGGGNPGEQEVIRNALKQMEYTLNRNAYGANVFSFYKSSPDPIQQSQSEQISERINAGAGLITFFGHSGTGGFDFSIDDPSTYKNKGKYPVMLSLGCLSGQMHSDIVSVGEDFVFQEEKGAIAFFATTGFGYIHTLNTFARKYYELIGGDLYGQGVGDILRRCIQTYANNQDLPTRTMVQQFSLDGDPALKVMPFETPDFIPVAESVRFYPAAVTAQTDSLELVFDVRNLGKAVADSIDVEVDRRFPDGVLIQVYKRTIEAPYFESEIRLKVPVRGSRAVGENRFFVRVDVGNRVAEGPVPPAETNNELYDSRQERGVGLYIFANSVSPVYPPDLGIAGDPGLTLQASTANPFAAIQKYLLEIDTTQNFDSQARVRKEIVQGGGLVKWQPGLSWRDSTVYYWRISPDTIDGQGYRWAASSFLFLDGYKSGWNQSHYYQFQQTQSNNMELSEGLRNFKFLDDLKSVRVKNGVYPDVWPEIDINNDTYVYLPWDNPIKGGLYICVLDSITADPWINQPDGLYGSHISPWAYWAAFPYSTQTREGRNLAIQFLRDIVPSGDYVVIYTVQYANVDYEPAEWAQDSVDLGVNLFQILEQQGASQLRQTAVSGAKPYVLVYKKDDPTFPVFEKMVEKNEEILESFSFTGLWDEGSVRSPLIGPAQNWSELNWKIENAEPKDEWGLYLYGIRADSTRREFIADWTGRDTTLQWLDAQEYPYVQLEYRAKDTLLRSAPRLPYWRVLYESIPEAALNPQAGFEFHSDTLQQGDRLKLAVAVENISPYPMDSLLMKYIVLDGANNNRQFHRRYRPLPAGDTLMATFDLDVRQIQGGQTLIVEANPDKDQPELTHFNNLGRKDFAVQRDLRNPLLDVTFDGTRILDGDLVSARPHIVVNMEDENPYLPLSDTSLFNVLIQYPGQSDVHAVHFDSGELLFQPAGADRNRATVEWMPEFAESGTYTLIVQGRDASGNQSGRLDYKVSFEVITESSISHIFNYPNPFSTSTQFVYTLTGSDPPAWFSIQIMTVSGRIVRTITQNEIGPLKIGTHRTDFAWDGTDEFGDRLANGVYLYRVVAKGADGKDFGHFENGTDGFFRNGFGKMVILR